MSLYNDWKVILKNTQNNSKQSEMFWKEYFNLEKEAYKQILQEKEPVVEGTVESLSKRFNMKPSSFLGFMDGISESLNTDFDDLESYELDSPVKIDINFDKLLYNMHKAKASWLYSLEEWNGIFTPEKQKEIADKYRYGRTVRKGPKIGRNEPCPCGSGKKYKNCCGKRKVSA